MFDSVRPHRWQPTRLPHPWGCPGKNTGVGCHFLLPCMRVKSESEVAQSCPTFSDPMDYSLPGSSIHGIFQARVLEWIAISFSIIFHFHAWEAWWAAVYGVSQSRTWLKWLSLAAMVLSSFPGGLASKKSTCNVGDLDLIPGLGRCPGGRHSNYNILDWRIPMDRGAWQATVHGIAKSHTWLSD